MAAKLVDWSLQNRFLVVVLGVLLVAGGGAAMQRLRSVAESIREGGN